MAIFGNKLDIEILEYFASLGIATIISLLGRCKANDEQLAYIESRMPA